MTDGQKRKLAGENARFHNLNDYDSRSWGTIIRYGIMMYNAGQKAEHEELTNGGWVHRFNSEEEFLEYLKMKREWKDAPKWVKSNKDSTQKWNVVYPIRFGDPEHWTYSTAYYENGNWYRAHDEWKYNERIEIYYLDEGDNQ